MSTTPLRYNYTAWSLTFSGMSIVFDVVVLCFPFPVIYGLQMTRTRKLQVIAIFWLGIFCCVASAVRFYFLYSEINEATVDNGPDRYLKTATAFIWGTVEPNVSIIAACLPCYAPYFAKGQGIPSLLAKVGSLFSSVRGSKGDAKHSGDDSLPLGSDGSYQLKKGNTNKPWERMQGNHSSYHVDVERTNDWQVDPEAVRYGSPFQIKVTRDFTATEVRDE